MLGCFCLMGICVGTQEFNTTQHFFLGHSYSELRSEGDSISILSTFKPYCWHNFFILKKVKFWEFILYLYNVERMKSWCICLWHDLQGLPCLSKYIEYCCCNMRWCQTRHGQLVRWRSMVYVPIRKNHGTPLHRGFEGVNKYTNGNFPY